MLQKTSSSEEEKEEPLEKALVAMTRSCAQGYSTEETTEPGIVVTMLKVYLQNLILMMSFLTG